MIVRTLLVVCCFCSTLATASSITLQEILQEHAKTLGSEAYRDNIQNLAYEIKIKEPTFEATAIYQATRAGQMRIDLYMQGDRVFTEAFDGETAWQWNFGDTEPVEIKGTAMAALRHGVELPNHINTLLTLEERGHRVQLLEERPNDHFLLKVVLDDGHEKYYELDPKTYRIVVSRDQRAFHPDWDTTEVLVESRRKDYQQFGDGWEKSFLQENWDLTNDKWLGSSEVTCLDVNLPTENGLFNLAKFKQLLPRPNCES